MYFRIDSNIFPDRASGVLTPTSHWSLKFNFT